MGQFRGKRCIFLKQLDSGLLLVTGPYKINGVNLRRVNQTYVISTSTKIDISSINVTFFKKLAKSNGKKGSEEFFEEDSKKKVVPQEKKDVQVQVDAAVLKAVAAVPQLKQYLNAKFTLTRNDRPHLMKF